MKAIILAGGFGTRLYPLTWGRPKSLAPLANLPFIDGMLSWLSRHGLKEIIVALNHFPEMICAYIADGRRWGVKVDYLLEEIPLGSGGAIKNAQDFIAGEATFLVVNGDVLTDLDLTAMLAFHRAKASQITISLTRVDDPSHFGVVDQAPGGQLQRFVEKPPAGAAPSNLINSGAWLFQGEMLSLMPPRGTPFSVEREFWPQCLAQGRRMFGYFESCYWLDIGTIERYLQANQDILAGKIRPTLREKEISPGIWLGAGAEVSPEALLTPPVILGSGVKIEGGAVVSGSVIGPETVIEAGAEVRDSVLWEKITVASGATILHSVIGGKQLIAGGSRLENFAIQDRGASPPEKK
jgi:NDP-sugar pyrophosphorylase family protein